MRVLALNAFHAGSHAAFLDGWRRHSRHDLDVITLPGRHWKWRLRHGALTFADGTAMRVDRGDRWDAVWCTDMLDLATFRALTTAAVAALPTVVYFHENQLTYPSRDSGEPDLQPAFTNFTTALAADAVWFNSDYHRNAFIEALRAWMASMPDHQPTEAVERIAAGASVQHPGIDRPTARRTATGEGPLRLVWAARWEHDKNPDRFFAALKQLDGRGIAFEVSVIGETYRQQPTCFAEAREWLGDRIRRWGWQPDRASYAAALAEVDVFVSTADHEFFGLAAVEAAAAGCLPVLPRKLAYPEVFGERGARWYDGSAEDLADHLEAIAAAKHRGEPLAPNVSPEVERFMWPHRAAAMDDALEQLMPTL